MSASVQAPASASSPARRASVERVSFVLPTLNEAENIGLLIEAIYEALPDTFEIVVVDDASQDGTANVVREVAARHPDRRIRLLERRQNPGLTNSLRDGIALCEGTVIGWMDCDFSMPPAVIPRLLSAIEQGYDIAVGSRFVRGGRFKENLEGTPDSPLAVFLSRAMNYSIQFFLDHQFKDYTSGFILIRKAVLDAIPLRGDYGEYFIDLMYRAIRAGYRFIEIPYVCLPRLRGESKTGNTLWQYLKRGVGYLAIAGRLRWEDWRSRRAAAPTPAARRLPVQDAREVTIASMRGDHIPLVAGLHHQTLYETLNSRLGVAFLEDLYTSVVEDPAARAWVALDGTRVVGFLSATQDLHATQARVMRSLLWRDRVIAAAHILTSRRDLRDYLSHTRFAWYVRWRFGTPYASILTVGVAPGFQGRGVASRLLAQAEDFFARQNVAAFFVDTLEHNAAARAFYEKSGFHRVGDVAGNVILRKTR